MIKRARLLRGGIALVAALAVGVLVIPAGAWFETQDNVARTKAQLTELRRENTVIQARVDELSDRGNIERQASEDFGMAYPGDETYAIIPGGPIEVDLPDVWPFNRLEDALVTAAR